MQTGLATICRVQTAPSAAMPSMAGVRAKGLPMQPSASARIWSACRITTFISAEGFGGVIGMVSSFPRDDARAAHGKKDGQVPAVGASVVRDARPLLPFPLMPRVDIQNPACAEVGDIARRDGQASNQGRGGYQAICNREGDPGPSPGRMQLPP